MGEEMVPPVKATDLRIYESASGTYLHAADLARLLRHQVGSVDAITALVLPRVADMVERVALRPTEEAS